MSNYEKKKWDHERALTKSTPCISITVWLEFMHSHFFDLPRSAFPLLWNLIEVKGDLETSCLRRHRGREVTDGRLCGHNLDSDSTLWWSSSFLIYLKWLTVKTFNYILNISSPFYIPIFFIWKKKKPKALSKAIYKIEINYFIIYVHCIPFSFQLTKVNFM